MDSDTFRQLTFGKLFTLAFQGLDFVLFSLFYFEYVEHADEIRATVKRAEKDFQLESTLKSYEEIWLSKTFQIVPIQTKQVRFLFRRIITNSYGHIKVYLLDFHCII
jgi:dynein heavy chain